MYSIIFIFVLTSGVFSQSAALGKCNKPEKAVSVHEKDLSGLLGSYHQFARTLNDYEHGDCATIKFDTLNFTTGAISHQEVLNNGTVSSRSGVVTKSDDFTIVFDFGELRYYNYVLATDKKNYIITYTCVDGANSNTRNVQSWVMTKTKQLSDEGSEAFKKVLVDYPELSKLTWNYNNQTYC